MCLEPVDKKFRSYSRDPKRSGKGWKVFAKRCDCFFHGNNFTFESVLDGCFMSYSYPIVISRQSGKWLREERYRRKGTPDFLNTGFHNYRIGWHIFLNRNDAYLVKSPGKVVRRVSYRKATAIGRLSGMKVVVAREIMI
jgi:hypothetical protein